MNEREDGMTLSEMQLLTEALARIDAKFALGGLVFSVVIAAIVHWSISRVWWIDGMLVVWVTLRIFWFGTAFRDLYRVVRQREEIEALTGDES